MKKRIKRFKEDYTKTFFIILAVVIILVIIFWVKLGLYINFLVGNDVLIKMDVDSDNVFINNGDMQDIKVEASVRTNPFCKAYCNIEYKDLNNGVILDSNEFEISSGMPFVKTYQLTNSNNMEGQDIYSFRMECSGKSSFLCHTGEGSTRRDMIITVNHGLNEEQNIEKEEILVSLSNLSNKFSNIESVYSGASGLNIGITHIESQLAKLDGDIKYLSRVLMSFQDMWTSQRMEGINEIFLNSGDVINSKIANGEEIINNVLSIVERYNSAVAKLEDVETKVDFMASNSYTNQSHFDLVETAIGNFNYAISNFGNSYDINGKESIANWAQAEIGSNYNEWILDVEYEVLSREINTDLNYDVLCNIDSNYCFNHPGIGDRAIQENFEIVGSCQYFDALANQLNSINPPVGGYPATIEFWDNVSAILSNKKISVLQGYINNIDSSQRNYNLINNIIKIKPLQIEAGYGASYIKNALLWQLIQDAPDRCTHIPGPFSTISDLTYEPVTINQEASVNVGFGKQVEQCCLFEQCYDCCNTEECRNSEDNYPIILVHGHAFNKDTSAEYSLDVFNSLQDKLEKDGYLSAGSINLYAEQQGHGDEWAKIPLPLTIKVSYYFDILQEEGNYQIIQTKSENIETYSLRLKEVIDVVKDKAQRPKVKIVAHSMGGLVVRRYLQIFGEENVESIVFVGSPHKGIVGQVADLCPILGEELECRDMEEGSTFMRKLELNGIPEVKVTNIVGSGCDMKQGDGDGVVLVEKCSMNGFTNEFINGNCDSGYLHSAMLDFGLYLETYNLIKEGIYSSVKTTELS